MNPKAIKMNQGMKQTPAKNASSISQYPSSISNESIIESFIKHGLNAN